MSDTGPRDDLPDGGDSALAAEYVLGVMSEDEAAAFEARLLDEPALEREVIIWTEHLAQLAQSVPEVAPPGPAKPRIEAAAFGDRPVEPRSFWGRWLIPGGFGLAAVAAAALVAVNLGLFAPEHAPEYVADIAVEDGALAIHAGWFDETDELLVVREAGEVPPGAALELWVIAGEGPPVSLGLVPAQEERTRYGLTPAVADLLPGGTLAVSQEPEGGSPTGAPTGPVLGTAPITEY